MNLIYQQNGVTKDNVFADWRTLMYHLDQLSGQNSIDVDASLVGGTATVPAGDWILHSVTLSSADASALPILSFDDGAHIVDTAWWRIADGLSVTNAGAPVWAPTNGSALYVDAGFLGTLGSSTAASTPLPSARQRSPRRQRLAGLAATSPVLGLVAASPFVTIGAAIELFVLMFNTGVVGDDTTATFNLTDPTAILSALGTASGSDDQLGQFSCTGVAGATVNYSHDSTSLARNIVAAGQVFNEILLSGAAETLYTPAVPANWAPPPPTQSAQALDRLAAAVKGLLGAPIP